MNALLVIISILLPVLCGVCAYAFNIKSSKQRGTLALFGILASSVAAWLAVLFAGEESIVLFHFTRNLTVEFCLDGMGRIFVALAATLWPLTALYATEYMKDEKHLRMFYAFFTISMGVTMGIACAGNMLTMYFFYEMLTLVTLPLVMHSMTKEAIRAARVYMYMSIGGAAFAFIAIVFLIMNDAGTTFALGGLLDGAVTEKNIMLLVYVLGFLGFGVKAAVFPLHTWLIKAAVAPTPVTALLHAVAVVKAGAFAVIRLTYYSFGADYLRGTWAQYVVMAIAIATILFGSSMALKQAHFKRRLAYSTVANMSYILFGITLMSDDGLCAGVLHMLFHSIIKIGAFFAAGAVLHNTRREYVYELEGLGKKMPVTFTCFTVFGLALTGVPLFNGFISKWSLATAAVATENTLAAIGAGALIISAMLTAIYMLTVSVRAYFPRNSVNTVELSGIREVNARMTVPMLLLAIACVATGIFAEPIIKLISVLLFK